MSNKAEVAVAASLSCITTEGSSVFREIEFHLAKKPYSSFPNSSGFKLETLNPSTSSSSSQPNPHSSSRKPEVSDFLDSLLDPDLTFRIPFRRIGAGLENLGNTCFLNSVLQCLTYTEPLVAYLQSGKHQTTCHIAGFCALCAIQRHVSRALQSTGRIVAPKDLVSNLRCISRNFRNARQEDAHEYMIHLLESMHKCCLPSGVPAQSPSAYEKSLVHKIFGGRLRSQVKCLQCSYCSNTFDPFLDLSLEIAKADSLYKALVHFTAAEQLDGGERQYKCERCKHKVRALKQLTIYKAPYILSIHLKRFRSHFGGQKIDKKVQFGSTLDLKPFVSGSYEGDLKYTLYGVLVHAGWSTHSGHYFCFVRTSSGLWYLLDDNRVVQVSEKSVLEQKAYMLFYVRDRKNFVPKKAMDIVRKESLITTMRKASSSCTTPNVKEFQNDCTPRNPSEAIPSSSLLKTSDNTKTSEDVSQKKTDTNSSEPLALKSPKVTGDVASADCKDKVQDQVLATKPLDLHCSSTAAGDGGNKSSLVINVAADTKDQDGIRCSDNDCKLENINPCGSAAQANNGSGTCKEETMTPKGDAHSVAVKSRLRLSSMNGSSKHPDCNRRRKLMKKILKTGVGMHLSTRMLYGASLSLKKRRRCKTAKQSEKNVLHNNMLTEGPVSAHVGPETLGTKLEASVIDEPPQASGSSTVANHVGVGSTNYSQPQNGVIGAPTMVLEETTVTRWEGVDPTLEIVDSSSHKTPSIGYVADEWDEEYDLGKRKKVRGPRHDFGGPNLFQEVAMQKAKRRRHN